MALSEDQKAMLRLLAQRGEQGYEDVAALMGIGVDEVYAKATEAAGQLESEGIPAPAIPPPPGASAAEKAPPPPDARLPAREGPAESQPPVTEKPAGPAPAPRSTAKPRRPTPAQRPRPSLPSASGARAAIAAGVLVVIALVVVLALSGGDSDETTADGSGEPGTAAEETVDTNGGANNGEVTQAVLEPVDGSDAKGLAVFGRVKNSLALQIEASGLEPTGKGESYTIWLYDSPRKMLPLASTAVGAQGRIASQVEVPTEVLGYLANETFDQIDISRTSNATLKASLAKATREKKAPIYTGTDLLRGRITGPIIGAAKRESGE
jgi:hypothetical protein